MLWSVLCVLALSLDSLKPVRLAQLCNHHQSVSSIECQEVRYLRTTRPSELCGLDLVIPSGLLTSDQCETIIHQLYNQTCNQYNISNHNNTANHTDADNDSDRASESSQVLVWDKETMVSHCCHNRLHLCAVQFVRQGFKVACGRR